MLHAGCVQQVITPVAAHLRRRQHFEVHDYFGLARSQVTFFQQGFLPCLTEQGQVIMETDCKVRPASRRMPACLQA